MDSPGKKDDHESGQALAEYAVIIFALVIIFAGFFNPAMPGSPVSGLLEFFRRLAGVICLPGP